MTDEQIAKLFPPAPFETERLIIRPPAVEDAAEINAAIRETIDALRPWMPWAQTVPTFEQSEENLREALRHIAARTDLRLSYHLKVSGTFVGGSGLHRIDWSVPKFEIGYWCRQGFQCQGYTTEAVRGIARMAFDTLQAERVEIRCDSRNIPSRRVAERAGFILDGVLRSDTRTPAGELRDTLVFSLTRAERGVLNENRP